MRFTPTVNKWSAVELTYLILNYNVLPMEVLCKNLLRTETQILKQVEKLNLNGRPSNERTLPTFSLDTDLSTSIKVYLSKEARKRLSFLEEKYGQRVPPPKKNKKYRAGNRADIGVSVRSGWEADILRWMKYHGVVFQYEPKVFFFNEVKKGNVSYLPDLYLPNEDLWVEIKGQIKAEDRVKTRRFAKYYPEEFKKLRVIVSNDTSKAALFYKSLGVPVYAYYKDISKEKKQIPHWGE